MPVLIATPNLCLDRTEAVAAVVPGAVLRADSVEVTAGGKGVNVARVLRAYGRRPPIVGLVARQDGHTLCELLAGEGATLVGVPAPGRVRQAIIMVEQPGGRVTVLNEPGSAIPPRTWDDYRDAVSAALPGRRLLVGIGSLPPGAPPDGCGQLVELARAAGALSVVDTAPGPLAATLSHRPDLVTPNLEEAEAALSGDRGAVLHASDQDVPGRAARAAARLCARGARNAAVTAGAHGVAFARADPAPAGGDTGDTGDTDGSDDTDGSGAHWIPAVPVEVVSPVGAGDSFVGGLALELLDLLDSGELRGGADPTTGQWLAALRRGTATAAASCEQPTAGGVDPARVADLLDPTGTPARGTA